MFALSPQSSVLSPNPSPALNPPRAMPLRLTEQHVTELLDINTAIEAVEEVLCDQAEGLATNRPRYRVAMPASQLHVMAAGDNRLGVTGVKVYTASRKGRPVSGAALRR